MEENSLRLGTIIHDLWAEEIEGKLDGPFLGKKLRGISRKKNPDLHQPPPDD